MKHYKQLYSRECKKNTFMQKQLKRSLRNASHLENRLQNLRKKFACEKQRDQDSGRTRKKKLWSNIKCDRTKHHRMNVCGNLVLSTIQQNLPECRFAQLTLNVGGKKVHFTWKGAQLKSLTLQSSNHDIFNFQKNSDHSYASAAFLKTQVETDKLEQIDYDSIFDSDGNWQKEHKRSIINVMDCYRISHESYHELRHAGKGHFPPLYQIINEKKIMSGEIKYFKHPTVRNLLG